KRKRVISQEQLKVPLEMGWQRETRIKAVAGRLHGDVAYYAPCGKRLRQYPDVVKGLQWSLLKEEEVIPRLLAMEGRRGRPPNSERQPRGPGDSPMSGSGSGSRRRKGRPPNVGESDFPNSSEAKLLRKLEAQEIARQAAQMKLMRKLEKQALAQAAKEARKQQAIMAAEERRKQKEQIKILKQQEKIKRIQQIRMEKELRAQQILEVGRSFKKAPPTSGAPVCERERLRQEKRDEKRLNKERKLELRRLELEMAKELKKPNEDLCLADHKPLPELSRIPGLVLPGGVFSDCLMVAQFLRAFGRVLGMEQCEVPTLGVLQEGLLNLGNSMGRVQDLLVRLLSAAVCDPGLPPGHKSKTILGDHLTNVGLNRDNVSEVLQMYLEAHSPQAGPVLSQLGESLRTKAFQAHTPVQKASVLAFLVNELSCSKGVLCGRNYEKYLCVRRLRNIHAKRTGKREMSTGGEELHAVGAPTPGQKRKRKNGDSDDEDDEDEDSDEQGEDEDEEEEEEGKKGKKSETCEEVQQQNLIRRKLFEASHSLRSTAYGQDRYRRRYWVLPQCGGVFAEAIESGEGPEELEKERARLKNFEAVQIKEEAQEEVEDQEKDLPPPNLFLLQPGDVAKLAPLVEDGSKASSNSEGPHHLMPNGCQATTSTISPLPAMAVPPVQPTHTGPPQLLAPQQSQQALLLPNDQLLRVLTERSGHWFSLLPRSPCDDSSLTSPPAPSSSAPSNSATAGALVKPGMPVLTLPLVGWPGGLVSPSLPLCSSPLPLHPAAEGCASPQLAPSVSTSKSESPLPPGEKPPCAPSPVMELPKSQDHPTPRPIPDDMLLGWWKVTDMEELRCLVKSLHSRGIREKSLQKQIQKYMELIAQTCNKNREGEWHPTLVTWCVEEQAMETDIALLQQVEELERKVTSASLQVKGWMFPEPQSEKEDLVYFEHKTPAPTRKGSEEERGLVRRPGNPLDIAVTRLAELERNIERRGEEELAPGMKVWRKALSEVRSSSQLAMCLQQLQKSIAWERSIMKVYCQICRKGDNEDLLLLCDGCDKGCHTYCHKPKICTIPEGDWYCPACISKASGQALKNKKLQSKTPPTAKKAAETAKRSKKQPEASEDDAASSTSGTPKKAAAKEPKKATPTATPKQDSPVCVKRAKTARDNNRDLGLCRILLAELERHQDAWPFLTPVNLKSVPGYRKVIKKPMDFSTIREKLVSGQYQNLETFIIDVNLVFDNCEKFNEDNSDIGRAGHNMRKFFEKRWTELLKQTN
uniref:Bromodomain adjacent to zinc finger domain protein 2B n=1 Tax=Denticeps clupeoides TaxID=299321 RepID=A0AAY4C1H8_9TELE